MRKFLVCSIAVALFAAAGQADAQVLAYVVNEVSDNISVVDATTGTVVTTFGGVGDIGGIGRMAVSPDESRIYLASSGSVKVIDTVTNGVIASIPVAGTGPSGIAISPDGLRVYAAMYWDGPITNTGKVHVINTSSNTVIHTIGFADGLGNQPEGIAVTPDGNRIYVVNHKDTRLSVFDTGTFSLVANIPVDGDGREVAISPDGTRAYMTSAVQNRVQVIDTGTFGLVTNISVGNFPFDLAVSPDGAHVYVGNAGGGGGVSVIETSSNTVLATIPAANVNGVAFSADGSIAAATDRGAIAAIALIDVSTHTVTATVPVGSGPTNIVFIGSAVASNNPPVADAGPPQNISCATSAGADVTLNGSGSSDPDLDPLTYSWSIGGVEIATGVGPIVSLAPGTHNIDLVVNDGTVDSAPDQVIITIVADTTPPEIACTVVSTSLWPPNHTMHLVVSGISASDLCDGPVAPVIAVSSDEAANGQGDGNTEPDYEVIAGSDGAFDVYVRAERSGKGDGRVYTITVNAEDQAENAAVTKTVEVTVPHSKGKGKGKNAKAIALVPNTYSLTAAMPNPFNPSTTIGYQIPEAGEVSLIVYNTMGQQVRVLVQGFQGRGAYQVDWDGRDDSGLKVSSGLYLYRFVSAGLIETRRMLLLK